MPLKAYARRFGRQGGDEISLMNYYEKQFQVIEWLKDYEAYKAGIENLKQAINDIAEEGMGLTYDKERVSPTNKFSSITENAVIKIDKQGIDRRIKTMTNVVNAIDKALKSLTDAEREIIINRCMKSRYYYQFCYKIGCSERTARRIKRDALKKMVIVIFGEE